MSWDQIVIVTFGLVGVFCLGWTAGYTTPRS